MRIFDHILDTIGKTPLVRFRQIVGDCQGIIAGKIEAFNPGGSTKDRIAVHMIDAAEKEGLLLPGGTIIECTSGNTGMGLALVASVRGYQAIFTMPDKVTEEKSKLLKAFGAEVITCPTEVEPDDPRSYYSVARKLTEEIENSFSPNQYFNSMNPDAHYRTTGPEIWEDTDGKLTHFVAGMGTGGTIGGVGRYLKEKNPSIQVIGADPVGSLYTEYFRTGVLGKAHSYKVEGIGEDLLPGTMDFTVIDEVIQVGDRESYSMARRLARKEGILSGSSAGTAVCAALEVANRLGPDDLLVVLIPDTGERYLSKVYDEDWLRRNQLIESNLNLTAGEILLRGKKRRKTLLFLSPDQKIQEAAELMRREDISQLPILRDGEPVGSLREAQVIECLLRGEEGVNQPVSNIMERPFPIVDEGVTADDILERLSISSPAVLVKTNRGSLEILTNWDLIHSVRRKR
ncbi:MAG TPA: pyridoxal-phosphate dependent enzyme [Planctomycetes bacterium]|nr:pyridoxal-phosphate dependent enzyme [Planctomycetota bacterium]HIN80493.1 pyridoxal-phosphate dependent enzyme [Planctomycetota bacterium]